jgi:hypothetical protein
MFTSLTELPAWFAEYCQFVADKDSFTITDANALWDLNQQ